MITAILLCWAGVKLDAPLLYYVLVVWSFVVKTINAYTDREIRKKVKSLWVYRNAPRN